MNSAETERPTITIAFRDFWKGFDPADNWWMRLLSTRYRVEFSDEPQLTIFSCYGTTHRQMRGTKVFVNWENRPWSFADRDWAFTSDIRRSPRHHRLPLWVAHLDELGDPAAYGPPADGDPADRGFASVVVSNADCSARERIHDLLNEYSPVASGGRHRNNVGGPVDDKLGFISKYKFHIACENSRYPGYATEKLLHGLYARTVPIYWGDPLITRDFNPHRFINVRDPADERTLLARVRELDRDPVAYREMLDQPWFRDGHRPDCADTNAVLDVIARALQEDRGTSSWRQLRALTTRGPWSHSARRLDRALRGAAVMALATRSEHSSAP